MLKSLGEREGEKEEKEKEKGEGQEEKMWRRGEKKRRTDREIDFIFSLALSLGENEHNVHDVVVCVRNNTFLSC